MTVLAARTAASTLVPDAARAQSGPPPGQAHRSICVAALPAFMLVALPSAAQANCTTRGTTVACDTASPSPWTTTIGTGPSTAAGTTVNVGANAQIVVGDANAIALGNNATITVGSGALVQNSGVVSAGLYGTGPNTIEFNNNGTLTVQAGGTVFAGGSNPLTEAVNPIGTGNVIDNFGTIRDGRGPTIFFNAASGSNTLINEAGGVIQASSPTTNMIGSSGSAINFTNMGAVIGALSFRGGTTNQYNAFTGSSVTGIIDGGAGGNNLLTLNGSGSGVMPNVLANWQSVVKTDSGTWTLSGANTYTGATSVNAGALLVDGSIASSSLTTVSSGAVLGGSGTVGTTTVLSGGTFAPGPSSGTPGTMTVAGNLAFQSGALYLVQVNPSTSSTTNVSGTAALAGTVQANFEPGAFVERTYTILTTTGGRTGTFDAVVGAPRDFQTSLSYIGNTVVLNLKAEILTPSTPTSAPVSFTVNQLNVGNAIDNFFNNGGVLSPTFLPIFNLTGSDLTNALSQLSGEAATGAQKVAFQLTGQFLNLMLDPFADGRGDTDYPALGFAPERDTLPSELAVAYASVFKTPPASVFQPRWTAWAGAYGGSNRTTGDLAVAASHDLSANTAGFASGLDYHLTPDSVVGLALAGGGTGWNLSQGLGGGKSDAFQAGLYGATRWGPAYLAAAFAFANHWMSTDRVAFGDHLTANFNAQSYGGRLEGGYRFATPYAGITPYAAIEAQDFHTAGYNETDAIADGFALAFTSHDATDTRSELGSRFDRVMLLSPSAVLALRGRLAWAHDSVSEPALTPVFQTLPGASFIVDGATSPHDSALASAGIELRLANGVTLLAKFDGNFAARAQTYAGTGALRYTW